MKFLYLMQELKRVPVDYRFSLYTYGPFDSGVLDDLRYAESLDAVKSTLEHYPGGYRYEFTPGPQIDRVTARAEDFLSAHKDDIGWVVKEFGSRTAADLEMISTIIFVDRAAERRDQTYTIFELATKVVEVKPHLNVHVVQSEAERLRLNEHLVATTDEVS